MQNVFLLKKDLNHWDIFRERVRDMKKIKLAPYCYGFYLDNYIKAFIIRACGGCKLQNCVSTNYINLCSSDKRVKYI